MVEKIIVIDGKEHKITKENCCIWLNSRGSSDYYLNLEHVFDLLPDRPVDILSPEMPDKVLAEERWSKLKATL